MTDIVKEGSSFNTVKDRVPGRGIKSSFYDSVPLNSLSNSLSNSLNNSYDKKSTNALPNGAGYAGASSLSSIPSRRLNPGMPLLKIESLSKSFGGKAVLNNINLSVNKSEIFGIIGLSGAGKTTLLELLIGFLDPDRGDIKLHAGGLLINETSSENYLSLRECGWAVKSIFGFATQKPSFYDDLSVRENLEYFGTMYGIRENILALNVQTVLDLVGLADQQHTLAGELSGGMQKRLDIACALVHNPKVLILDEPTADLDVVLRKQIWELARKINQNGTTIILTSHFLDEIESLCSRIVILHNNCILREGSVDDLKKLYANRQEIHLFLKNSNYGRIISHLQHQNKYKITKIAVEGRKLIIYSPEAEKLLHHLIHVIEHFKEEINDIYLSKPSLNDIFELLTAAPAGQ